MSYTNPRHEGRLILIPNLQDAFAILHVSEAPRTGEKILKEFGKSLPPFFGSIESALEGAGINFLYKMRRRLVGKNGPPLFHFFFLFLMATLGTKRTTTC